MPDDRAPSPAGMQTVVLFVIEIYMERNIIMYSLLLALIYLAFISLGLPDSLLGAAWPSMYPVLEVPVSFAGIISMTISVNTVISSLFSDRLTKRFGAARVTAVSVGMTAAAMLGFSCCGHFWQLCVLAVPYGLGAGSVDAALNNYVALHYKSRHMSWLHCMWGVGTIVGSYVIGAVLSGGRSWGTGYRLIGAIQVVLTALLFLSIPLWKKAEKGKNAAEKTEPQDAGMPLPLKAVVRLPGAKEVMTAFFCYCALEQTTMLWASSYMVLFKGIDTALAAKLASLFFIGITAGRAVNGFLMMKFSDTQMIRAGQVGIGCGILLMLLPLGNAVTIAGFLLIGFGCAPIYPCIIHATPARFGEDKSQALIGVQMAAAYIGTSLMPPVFGLIANNISAGLLPLFLALILVLMIVSHESLVRRTEKKG